jgi:hypothetical protein
MMHSDDLVKIIAALGVGSGASAVGTAIIAARSGKGKSRAEAADLLVNAAERVGKMNASLDDEVRALKAKIDLIQLAMFQYLGEEISKEELLQRVRELRQ